MKMVKLLRTPKSALRWAIQRLVPEAPEASSHHFPSLGWVMARLLLSSSKNHAFLDRASIPLMFRLTPKSSHKGLGLRLLSLSPHYWIYQFNDSHYPKWYTRRQVLDGEFTRNADSRRVLAERVLQPFLKPGTTALDFGSGPGFLANAVSRFVGKVIAADISRGVAACAKAINGAPNIDFVVNRTSGLPIVEDHTVDLVYTFAVFQHLLKEQTASFLHEFHRVLKPGGQGVCHMILKETGAEETTPEVEAPQFKSRIRRWLYSRLMLRMTYYTKAEMTELLTKIGYRDIRIVHVKDVAKIDDDIGHEHLLLFKK